MVVGDFSDPTESRVETSGRGVPNVESVSVRPDLRKGFVSLRIVATNRKSGGGGFVILKKMERKGG